MRPSRDDAALIRGQGHDGTRQRLFACVSHLLLVHRQDSLRDGLEPLKRYRLAALIRNAVCSILNFLQRAFYVTNPLIVRVTQSLVDLFLGHCLSRVLELLGFAAVLLLI